MAPYGELPTCWPATAGKGAMVHCVRIEASVDELFHTTWIAHALADAHHKARGDTNFRVTPWVASKAALESCEWYEPSDPAVQNPSIATSRFRKVRFDSVPSAFASKPFENQETIQCSIFSPGKQYVLEAITSTNAPYGDKFGLFIRYTLTAESRTRCTLLITHHVEWDPSMNFMLKPMVAKGVDVGLRAAFKTYRQLLGDFHTCTEITEQDWEASRQAAVATGFMHTGGEAEEEAEKETQPAEEQEEEVGAAAAAAHAREPAGRHAPEYATIHHPPSLLNFLSEQLVYRDQVPLLADVIGAGMRSISDQGMVARVLAVVLTLTLVSVAVSVIRAAQSLCAAGGAVLWAPCFPLTHLIDLPDSMSEVLTALALVALVNYGIMKASELSVAYLNKNSAPAPHSEPQHHQHPQAHHAPSANAHVQPGPTLQHGPGSAPAESITSPSATVKSPAGGATKAPSPAPTAAVGAGTAGAAAAAAMAKSAAAQVPASKGSAVAVTGAEASAGSGAGASKAAASAAQKPAGGKPPKGGEAGAPGQKQGKPPPAPIVVMKSNNASPLRGAQGPGAAAARAQSESVLSPPAIQSPHTEMEMQCLSPTQGRSASALPAVRPATAGASTGATAAATGAGAGLGASSSASDVEKLMRKSTGVTAAVGSGGSTPAMGHSRGGSGAAGGAGSQGGAKGPAGSGVAGPRASQDGHSLSASPTGEERTWLDSLGDTFKGAWQKSQITFISPGQESPDGLMAVASSPNLEQGAHDTTIQKSSSVAALGGPSMTSITAAPVPASAHSVTLSGGIGGGAAEGSTLSSASFQRMMNEEMPDEEPDVVEEEVFENERFQPFRLWGHSWPGHFLPSDRVGHWSDKLGGPYGPTSMEFDHVAPKCPNDGWRWLDDKWKLDMDGFDVEAVDADGWFYALDFNYLKRHPAVPGTTVGSGKCNPHHFVRRRRWVRRRARIGMDGSSPMPIPQSFNKDSGMNDDGRAVQRMLRASADDVFRSAAAAAMAAGAAAGAADAASSGTMSMPCSPTQATPLAASPPSAPAASSWPALQPPSSDSMDRVQGSAASSQGGAAALPASLLPTVSTSASGAARVTVESGVPEAPSQQAAQGGASGATASTVGVSAAIAAAAGNGQPASVHGRDAAVKSTAALMAAAAAAATAAAAQAAQASAQAAVVAQTTAPAEGQSSAAPRAKENAHTISAAAQARPAAAAAAPAAAAPAVAAETTAPPAMRITRESDLQASGSLRALSTATDLTDAPRRQEDHPAGSLDADFSFQKPSGNAAPTGHGAASRSAGGAVPHTSNGGGGGTGAGAESAKASVTVAAPSATTAKSEEDTAPPLDTESSKGESVEDPLGLVML